MTNLFLKLRIWTKVALLTAIAVYVLLFFLNNTNKNVDLWLWFGEGRTINTTLLVLIPAVFLLGIVTAVLVRTILRTVTQFRELRRRKVERDAADVVARAAKLRTRDSVEVTRATIE